MSDKKRRRPDIRSAGYNCWPPLGINPTHSRSQAPVIRLIKQVYAPLLNDYLLTRGLEDASGILKSKAFRDEFQQGCRDRLGQLPEAIRNHEPDREKLVGLIYDVLRYSLSTDSTWLQHMELPRGSNKMKRQSDLAPAMQRKNTPRSVNNPNSSSPSGPLLRGSSRVSIAQRVSPRTPTPHPPSSGDSAPVPPTGLRLTLRSPGSEPPRRPQMLRVSPRKSLPAPATNSSGPVEQPQFKKPAARSNVSRPPGQECRLKDLMQKKPNPQRPDATQAIPAARSPAQATKTRDAKVGRTVKSNANAQPATEHQPKRSEPAAPLPQTPRTVPAARASSSATRPRSEKKAWAVKPNDNVRQNTEHKPEIESAAPRSRKTPTTPAALPSLPAMTPRGTTPKTAVRSNANVQPEKETRPNRTEPAVPRSRTARIDRISRLPMPAMRSKGTHARRTVQSNINAQREAANQGEAIEPERPRPPRPPRPVKGTPEWDIEYRKRLIPLQFHNKGTEYDLLDQDWVMDSDPFDENYGLRDPALGPIFGPPEEPRYAKYPWERDP